MRSNIHTGILSGYFPLIRAASAFLLSVSQNKNKKAASYQLQTYFKRSECHQDYERELQIPDIFQEIRKSISLPLQDACKTIVEKEQISFLIFHKIVFNLP